MSSPKICTWCGKYRPCNCAGMKLERKYMKVKTERDQLIKVVDGMADYIYSIKEFRPASYNSLPHVIAKKGK